MQDRLTMCGVRPISNIVDITNYVMLETGQPMHAFDLAKMRQGKIIARRAKAGETMTTLDGKKRTLTPDMLVIADAECAEDIGGVMGGASSEITSSTKRIVFEAAYFTPAQIRSTSRVLGLKTEASSRFERGADRTAPPRAMKRAIELLEQIGGGKPEGHITDVYPSPYQPKTLRLDRARISGLLGMDVPDSDVERILNALGFEVRSASARASTSAKATADKPAGHAGWEITPPAWRVDMHREVDLIEEVGRHYGFEHLPTTFPGVEQAPPPSDPRIARDRRIRTALLGMGFSEAITFAFMEAWKELKNFGYTRGEWFEVVCQSFRCRVKEEMFHAIYERFSQREAWRLFDDVLPALELARSRNLKLGIISNWDERLKSLLEQLGLISWFDLVLVSGEFGAHKPDPKIFQHAARHFQVEAEEVLHIGDSEREDIAGATQAGLQARKIIRLGKSESLVDLLLPYLPAMA
jgi:REG-2-like HAD superfamily hydrolase